PVEHECTHASGYGIRLDDALDGGSAVYSIRRSKSAGRPERRFTGRGPEREVCHARQRLEANVTQGSQPLRHGIEQGGKNVGSYELEVAPKLVLGTPLRICNRSQGEENGSVAEIRPADPLLDAVQ